MNTLLQQQLDQLLADAPSPRKLPCESALRVGAATVGRGKPGEITAATVVCDVAADDVDAVASLIADIAGEYGLDASLRQHTGTYSVRFSCLPETAVEVASTPWVKSALARLLRR
jgi:hypothetical protein